MTDFTKDDFNAELSDGLARTLLNVVLAFARFDTALSAWLVQAYGMPLDRGSLLVENMDIGNKIIRLRKIYSHRGETTTASNLTRLKKQFDQHRVVRNTIAHATCCGTLKGRGDTVIFAPLRASGSGSDLQIIAITSDQLVKTTDWARVAAESVIRTFEKLEGQVERIP
jgi:hypothetical protein